MRMISRTPRSRLASCVLALVFLFSSGGGKPAITVIASPVQIIETSDREVASSSNSTVLSLSDGGMDNRCWIFTHLQKCGGSTVKEIILHRWGEDFHIYDNRHWKRGDTFTAQFAEHLLAGSWHVSGGGYVEGLRSHLRDRCDWFTMFRHPIPRLVSAFFYCKEVPTDVACASDKVDARVVDFVTFAKHWGNFAMRQLALGLIDVGDVIRDRGAIGNNLRRDGSLKGSGWYMVKVHLERERQSVQRLGGVQSLPDEALHDFLLPTLKMLQNNYTAVGILEHFEESLELFNRALGMPELDWHTSFAKYSIMKKDRAFETQEKKLLAEAWTNGEIKQYIVLDLVLYDHAVAIFNRQKDYYSI